MSFSSQEFESYVPLYDTVPEKWEDARPFLVEALKKISNGINVREIGWYLDEELLSGKQFFPTAGLSGTSQQNRSILRKVIDFGALPNTTLKQVAHGIQIDANFSLIHLYACATDPIALTSFEIDHAEPSPGFSWMFLDATKVNIITGSDRSAYTRTYVVIEYIQEV